VLREKIGLIVEGVPPEEAGQVRRVFESIFGLTGENGEPPLEGETFKGMLFTVMFTLWHRRATHRPVVAVCDDLHWSDQASIDLLLHLFPLTEQVPLLLLCALRPDRKTPGWGVKVAAERDYPHRYTELSLEPLTVAEGSQLVESLLTISELPVRLKERILEKSEGNPFFIEEVLRTLIDQGVVVRDGSGSHWLATGEGEDIEIPGNLQTLLVARIDLLAEDAQRTLQVASVVGRSFYYRVLQRIVALAEELDTTFSAIP
jgi:predicted ATPase